MQKSKQAKLKAQLRMGESIIVLLVFFILLTLGAVFYARINVETSAQEKNELKTVNAIKVAQEMAKMPELICTKEGVEDFDCFDKYKYKAFEYTAKHPFHAKYYDSLFPNVNATIVELYPNKQPPITILNTVLLSTNEKTGEKELLARNSQKFFIPVTIFNPIEDISSFGYLEIEVFS